MISRSSMIQTRFVYSDGNANNGGWESAGAGDASVTEHWSNTAGATLDITFNGTKLELYGKKLQIMQCSA